MYKRQHYYYWLYCIYTPSDNESVACVDHKQSYGTPLLRARYDTTKRIIYVRVSSSGSSSDSTSSSSSSSRSGSGGSSGGSSSGSGSIVVVVAVLAAVVVVVA